MGFEWDDKYRLGIEEIDEQHKAFFDRINALLKDKDRMSFDINSKKDKMKLYWELYQFRRYAFIHFLDEEELMLKHKYVRFFSHKSSHDQFIKDILAMEESMGQEKNVNLEGLIKYIAGWLENHITDSDMLFAEFLRRGSNAEEPE